MVSNKALLHPAAEVFRNQLLVEVGEENERMERKMPYAHLGTVELHLAAGGVALVSLQKAFVMISLACRQCARVDEPFSYPLSEFRSGRVSMTGLSVGKFPGQHRLALLSTDSRSKTATLKLIAAKSVVIEGQLRLHRNDFKLCKDKRYGEELLHKYLTKTGKGLRNPQSAEFTAQIVSTWPSAAVSLRETSILGITAKASNLERCEPIMETLFRRTPATASAARAR